MKRRLLYAALFTLFGFPLIGLALLAVFTELPWQAMLRGDMNIFLQLIFGFPLGLILGSAAWFIVDRPFLKNIKIKYARIIGGLRLNTGEVIFISFCAGFGEELLFRGAIQPMLGIWLTAVIFVAIHGYLNPMNRPMSLYGLFMVAAIALIGYLTEWWGVFAASSAHMAIDFVLFRKLITTSNALENRDSIY